MELHIEKFRENLIRILQEKNISQTQLAKDTEISRVAINRWIKMYKLPRLDTFVIIADALGVEAEELLDGMIRRTDED